MLRWFWTLLALSAVVVAVMLAVLRPGGLGDHRFSAQANDVLTFAIDADPWGDGITDYPCKDIDATNIVDVDDDHMVAVCVVNTPEKDVGILDDLSAFGFTLTYDDSLNECKQPDPSCPGQACLDDNPDANAGATLGAGHVPTTVNLGGGWGCPGLGSYQPTCGGGQAAISCMSYDGPWTSSGLEPFPLAVVSFKAIADGTDTIDTTNDVWGGKVLGDMPVDAQISADVFKGSTSTPTPTTTPTPTPEFTATPLPANADMGVTLADDPDPVIVGEEVEYTATVKNWGDTDTTGVELIVTLPAAKDYVSSSINCGCVEDPAQTLTCALGPMDVNDETVCTITATAITEGDHDTTASVSSDLPDFNEANDTATEETTEVLPHAYIDKDITNGGGPCALIDATSHEVVGDTHQLAVCVDYLPEDVSAFDLTIRYNDSLDTCDDETPCPVDDPCLEDNPNANDGEVSEWGGVGLGDDWNCFIAGTTPYEPTCHIDDQVSGEAWISCHANPDSSTTLRSGALAVLTLYVADHGIDNVDIYSLQIWGDEAIIAQCLPPTAPQGILGAALPMVCEGATDTKEEPTATPTATNTPAPTNTPTITPTPQPETHKRATKTPTPAPTATPTQVAPTQPPPPPPPTATPFGGVGPEIVPPPTGSGPSNSAATWTIWLLAGIAGAAAAGGFYFRYAKKTR